MTFGQTTARMLLSAALLASVGCATRSARTQFASSGNAPSPAGHETSRPTHHRAQLLAAARQYEKEGRPDLAVRYYRQALAAEGQSTDTGDRQDITQPGRRRNDSEYRQIIAGVRSPTRPRLQSRQDFSLRNSGIDKRTAQIIANAAARATAEAIANAASHATEEYLAKMAAASGSQTGEPDDASPSPPSTTVSQAANAAVINAVAESVHQPANRKTSHGHQESYVQKTAYTDDREQAQEPAAKSDSDQQGNGETACNDETVCKCETASDAETADETIPAMPEEQSDHATTDRPVASGDATDGEIPKDVGTTKTEAVKEDVATAEAAHPEVTNGDIVNVEIVTSVADELATIEPSVITTNLKTTASQALPQVIPRDWGDDSRWRSTSLTRLCHDANAAVLREVAKLDSGDPQIRNEGLRALAGMGPDASSATLAVRMLLHDDVDSVQAHAAWATWALTGDAHSAGPLLTELLESDDAGVVQFAAYSLSEIGNGARTALPTLGDLLKAEDKLIQVHAAEALVRIAPPASRAEAIDLLIMMTADPSAQIRVLALLALGRAQQQPTASVTTALTSALHDSDAAVRAVAALTLGGFGPSAQSTIAQLEFVAESDQQDVQQAAATALDCIRR